MKILLLLTALSLYSCTKPNEPEEENLQPGRRDYVWTVDTLNIPFTFLTRMWGSSANDVWLVGPGGDKDKTIFHFDGVKWNNDGISRPLAPTAIFGFSPNNVWIGGHGGDIWNYDGTSFNKVFTLNIPGYRFVGIEGIWGDATNNVYAVGYAEDGVKYKGIIAKYDGFTWTNINIPEIQNSFLKIMRGNKSSNNYFIAALRFDQLAGDSSCVYEFDGTNLNIVYKGGVDSYSFVGVHSIDNIVYIRKGREFYEYKNKTTKLLFSTHTDAFLSGRNKKDIIVAQMHTISHYNGEDVQCIYSFNSTNIETIATAVFEKDVFILAYDFSTCLHIIYRGTLK